MRFLLCFLLAWPGLHAQSPWIKHYTPNVGPGVAAIALDDNSLLVVGEGGALNPNQVALHRIDPAGNLLWTRYFNDGGWLVNPLDLTPTANGNAVLLAASEHPLGPYRDAILIKTTLDGDTLWRREFGGPQLVYPADLVETPGGELLVAGSALPGTLPQFYLAKIDGNDGAVLWEKTYDFPSNYEEWYTVAVAPDGAYAAAGYTSDGAMVLSKLDTAGVLLWTQSYGQGNDGARAVRVLALSDGYLVAGNRNVGVSSKNPFVVRTDLAGDTLWTYAPGPTTEPKNVFDALATADGGTLLSGWQREATAPFRLHPAWFKLNDLGELVWQQHFVVDSTMADFTQGPVYALTAMPAGDFALIGGWGSPYDQISNELLLIRGAVDSTVSLRIPPAITEASVFPNPAQDRFCWELPGQTTRIEVELMSATGQRLQVGNKLPQDCWAPVGLSPGPYLLRFQQRGKTLALRWLVWQ